MRSRWAIEIYRVRQRTERRRAGSAGPQTRPQAGPQTGPRTRWQGPWFGLVLITFVVLKLSGVINWSWLWVLSPLWIGGILLVLALCVGVVLLRRAARKQMHEWMNHFVSGDWLR